MDGGGAVYVLRGPVLGAHPLADETIVRRAADDGDALSEVTPAGDVDGDGFDDLLMGARGAGNGTSYLFYGPLAGIDDVASADAVFTGALPGDDAGSPLGAGDVDGDGLRDLVFGAPGAATPPDGAGAISVLYGSGL